MAQPLGPGRRNSLGAEALPRNDDYARATLAEIIGEDRLAAATRMSATELRSGVLLSQPDGPYRFEPLPRIAQIAPADGIVAGDFDGGGHADIYAVQNSYAPSPAIGRFDGGLSQLLRGDGRGHFSPVPPAESGLVVPGDAKALAVLDLGNDGWPGFLCIAERRQHPRISRPRRRGPAFASRCRCAEAREPAGGRGAGHRGIRRRHNPDRRGLRRLGLLQPVDRSPVLRLHRPKSASTCSACAGPPA